MIRLSTSFDLGRDRLRITNLDDARRQKVTAQEILDRFFAEGARERWPIQVLADEVGMGKTFVGLAVGFTLLQRMMEGRAPRDLDGCYQKLVIIAPSNPALLAKWYREVSEFVVRCADEQDRPELAKWFKAKRCDRLDHFVEALQARGNSPRVIVAPMGIFGNTRLGSEREKIRVMLWALFQCLGARLDHRRRKRLLEAAPENLHWPRKLDDLNRATEYLSEGAPFRREQVCDWLRATGWHRGKGEGKLFTRIFQRLRELSHPYRRGRSEQYGPLNRQLGELYREVVLSQLGRAVPLVIVDEAHHWKNGPSEQTHGYDLFAKYLACRTRRLLLLTATPFQLRPKEMLELLRIGQELKPQPARRSSRWAQRQLRVHCEEHLEPLLDLADASSKEFARLWARLKGADQGEIHQLWVGPALAVARSQLREAAAGSGRGRETRLRALATKATTGLEPAMKAFMGAALVLDACNHGISRKLGPLVIRHRRRTTHRVFRVGHEYGADASVAETRPDYHVLHAAPGLDVRGAAELPHYILMKCISNLKEGKGRTSLGSALTGCYSTLLESHEGRRLQSSLARQEEASKHFPVLLDLVAQARDVSHPKLSAVVEETVAAWRRGEKTLIFCFRTHTAERLHNIISSRLTRDIDEIRGSCLGQANALKTLRGRLTGREGDLVPLVLDRVLWSLALTKGLSGKWPFAPDALRLRPEDLRTLATVYLQHGIKAEAESLDRVFLSRAVEHVVAGRLLRERPRGMHVPILERIADPRWVEWPYGLTRDERVVGDGSVGEGFQPRGVHTQYPLKQDAPDEEDISRTEAKIRRRHDRAKSRGETSLFDVDADGSSLWFGGAPSQVVPQAGTTVRKLHEHIAQIIQEDGEVDWESRRLVFEGMRRTVLREAVLVRVLQSRQKERRESWGAHLVEGVWQRRGDGQEETFAERLEVFLEDLRGASGSLQEEGSARATQLEATRLRDQRLVALVKGGDIEGRERAFAGFNTPLHPEVLVCTAVGAEGIDLHRQCRHVVHYDLAWNPAVLEQRTGRIDRIGSKAFRDRQRAASGTGVFLEVGVPYLAGTYDERMYEELRLRAQRFEVLTGGDVAADQVDGDDEVDEAEGNELGLRLVPLPGEMVEDLRVKLAVWRGEGGSRRRQRKA